MESWWSFVWTPQFLVGTLVAGLLLNVISAYVVRFADRVAPLMTASFRRVRAAETARIERLTAVAMSDNAMYAALTAEASRLRLRQLLRFFVSFLFVGTFLLLYARGELAPAATLTARFLAIVVFVFGLFQYLQGLTIGSWVRRLEAALARVQVQRQFPIASD